MTLSTQEFNGLTAGWDYKKALIGKKIKSIQFNEGNNSEVSKDTLTNKIETLKKDLETRKWKNDAKRQAKDMLKDFEALALDFTKLDVDGNGTLSEKEAKSMVKHPGLNYKHEDLLGAYFAADHGTITEYGGLFNKKVKGISLDGITRGDNVITMEETKARLQALEVSVRGREFKGRGKQEYLNAKESFQLMIDNFATVDTNGDGKITLDER